eukprot:scaffold2294_cov84-Cyclotella_meneghiniana.AAC.2
MWRQWRGLGIPFISYQISWLGSIEIVRRDRVLRSSRPIIYLCKTSGLRPASASVCFRQIWGC